MSNCTIRDSSAAAIHMPAFLQSRQHEAPRSPATKKKKKPRSSKPGSRLIVMSGLSPPPPPPPRQKSFPRLGTGASISDMIQGFRFKNRGQARTFVRMRDQTVCVEVNGVYYVWIPDSNDSLEPGVIGMRYYNVVSQRQQ
jgi:hypothetical protein